MLILNGLISDRIASALGAEVTKIPVCQDKNCCHNSHMPYYNEYSLPDPDETWQDEYGDNFYRWGNTVIRETPAVNETETNPLCEV